MKQGESRWVRPPTVGGGNRDVRSRTDEHCHLRMEIFQIDDADETEHMPGGREGSYRSSQDAAASWACQRPSSRGTTKAAITGSRPTNSGISLYW